MYITEVLKESDNAPLRTADHLGPSHYIKDKSIQKVTLLGRRPVTRETAD